MELSRLNKCVLVVSVLLGVCSVFVSGLPQWVWNPDAETGPKNSIGSGNRLVFGEKEKPNIKLDETQARLFLPSIVNAITGGGRPGIFGNFLQNIFGGNSATTLPAGIGSGNGGGSSGGSGAQCTCEDRSRGCFLPARETGSCDSGTRIQCCTSTRGSRTVFPEDNFSSTSSNNNVRTVTRSQIRRALLKNIVRGSGSIVDDTLDLILHPFLTKEDQLKVATRVLSDE